MFTSLRRLLFRFFRRSLISCEVLPCSNSLLELSSRSSSITLLNSVQCTLCKLLMLRVAEYYQCFQNQAEITLFFLRSPSNGSKFRRAAVKIPQCSDQHQITFSNGSAMTKSLPTRYNVFLNFFCVAQKQVTEGGVPFRNTITAWRNPLTRFDKKQISVTPQAKTSRFTRRNPLSGHFSPVPETYSLFEHIRIENDHVRIAQIK